CQRGGRAGIILIPIDGEPMPLSFKLEFECTNNIAEYKVLVLGLQAAYALDVKSINIFGDSQLVINQVNGMYQCRNEILQKYKHNVDIILTTFDRYTLQTIPCSTNKFTDTMACLASQIPASLADSKIFVTIQRLHSPSYLPHDVYSIRIDTLYPSDLWYKQYSDYLSLSILPPDLTRNGQRAFLKKVSHYVILGGLLYKHGFDGILLQCLTSSKIPYTIKE
ncbi:hypothetical protein KI387_028612, partial [Taxus chinensis]